VNVAENQPAKLAAFEGLYETDAPADLYLVGWVDETNQRTSGLAVPNGLSWLLYGDAEAPVTGLNSFEEEDRPPVNIVFQSYHLMVAIGMLLIAISLLSIYFLWRRKLFQTRWLLWVLTFSVLGPQLANQLGWLSAEVGRQPWIVYDLLRTSDGISPAVSANNVLISLILFGLIYLLLFILFVYLLNEKIQHGPEEVPVKEGRMA
jgi:cytochrome d ubiquinol oxidase subunit I